MTQLKNKRIVLGVTGSIAAYKSIELVRRLTEMGATVRVVMTAAAQAFITPLTMQAVSGLPVHQHFCDPQAEATMGHIELARWADVLLIAPATADIIARLAHGRADDLLTALCLVTRVPIIIAPAMNQAMWQHALTQQNIHILQKHNIQIIDPEVGQQACGDYGPGRMVEPARIAERVIELFVSAISTTSVPSQGNYPGSGLLAGQKVLITAGPTREALDPVRYLSNHSSGKMGYAMAQAAHAVGAEVMLVSGPTVLQPPVGVHFSTVTTAQDMYDVVLPCAEAVDIFIGVAAVADYCLALPATEKHTKQTDTWQLTLTRTPDIISAVANLPISKRPWVVGFAAETGMLVARAREKQARKRLDMIIANPVGVNGVGFDSEDNEVTVLWQQGEKTLPKMPKVVLAKVLIELIAAVKRGQ